MLDAHRVARKYLKRSAERSKEMYDTGTVLHRYKPGDLVWVLHEGRKKGVTPKLEKRYDGPFVVVEALSANFSVQTSREGSKKTLHHNKVKPNQGENQPKWVIMVAERLRSA